MRYSNGRYTSHDLGDMHSNILKQRKLEICKRFSYIHAVRDLNVDLRFFDDRCRTYGITDEREICEMLQEYGRAPV